MTITLEQDCSFSQSMVWTTSREYYINKGVEAWSESVPFYITSNALIAKQYADILLGAMQSWAQENPSDIPVCFPILELGAGCGQFAFLIIRALNEAMESLQITAFTFQYIVSDLSAKSLSFMAEHPLFSPYVANKQCRFSLFDLENDESIELLEYGGHPAETLIVETPLLLVANYLFDSLSADVFYVNDNNIQEARVSLSTEKNNLHNGSPKDWKKVDLSFSKHPVAERHYDDEIINTILHNYASKLDDTHVIFPIGSLKAIQLLRRICQQPLLILLSDKCFNNTSEMEGQKPPDLDVHGSFSTMVNLDALSQYCLAHHGHSIIPTPRDGLTTAVLAFGMNPNTMPLLAYPIQQHLEQFSPTDFFNLYETLVEQHTKWSLEALSSALTLSHWDPGLFSIMADHLQKSLAENKTQVVDYILSKLPQVAAHFYPIPAVEDVYFQIGAIFYALDHYEKAIHYYKASLSFYPDGHETHFNLALCHLYLESYDTAVQHVTHALELDPNNESYLSTHAELEKLVSVNYA